MPENKPLSEPESPERPRDEGGLRAPPGLSPLRKAWWWFDFIVLVNLARLRFVAVLAVIGLTITKWDTLQAYYNKWTRPSHVAVASDVEWFCPMHPTVVREEPGECPICFMPLAKRKKGATTEEVLPAGVVNRVQLSPYRVVLAGASTTELEYQPAKKVIDAVGYIEFNEQGQRTVSARAKGRIEKLIVNETGRMVNQGDELAWLYSPELLATAENLLDADRAKNAPMVASARRRLELLGVDGAQIDEMEKTKQASTHIVIRSPISGHVLTKYVQEGQYVDEGKPLYDLADLSEVWIEAQIYEEDLALLPLTGEHGQAAEGAIEVQATTRSLPGETFTGKLAFVYPHVDQNTRTATLRFVVANPKHRLRPGSTANVAISIAPREIPLLKEKFAGADEQLEHLQKDEVLAVPESAVIDTGTQKMVYSEARPGVYDAKLVELGPALVADSGEKVYPVLSGVEAHEKIVTGGSFLIDAETRLNPAAGSIYFGGSGSDDKNPKVTTVRPSTPQDVQAESNSALAALTPADRAIAEKQKYCAVLDKSLLGSMGTPIKLTIGGETVFICCPGCKEEALKNPERTLKRLRARRPEATAKSPSGATRT